MRTVKTTSVHAGGAAFCAETRGHQLFCDVPQPMGGEDQSMTPVEALLAALGNCLGTVIVLACRNKGLEVPGLKVDVQADFLEEEHRLDNFVVTVHVEGELDEATKRAIHAAEPLCNVHNTLVQGAKVTTVIAE